MVELGGDMRELFRFLAEQLPEMVAMLIGIVVCLAQSGRYPRPALFGVLGFGLMLIASASGAVIIAFGPDLLPEMFGNHDIGDSILFGVRSAVMAAGCLLVLWGLFSARGQPVRPPYGTADEAGPRKTSS